MDAEKSPVTSVQEMTEVEIRELRIEVDNIISKIAPLPYTTASHQAWLHLKNAKHWMGEMLGEIGLELPAPYRDEDVLAKGGK